MISKKKIIFVLVLACLFLRYPPFCLAQPAALYNNAEFNRAIKLYRSIADKNDITGYLNLAMIFKDLAHYELGIKVLKAARIKFKDDFRLLGYLGRVYYLNGQFEESIRVLERLTRIKPNDREALITLGLCYQEKGNDVTALEYFKKALELDNNNVIARLSLADLYSRQNKLEESSQEYKALSFIDASLGQIYEYWGDILFKTGNFKEALRLYEKITFKEPQNKFALERLEEIRGKLGKEYFERERAKREVSKGRKIVFVKPAPKIKNAVTVRIGLVRTDGSAEFKCSTDFTVKTKSNQILVGRGGSGQSYTILQSGPGKLLISRDKQENMIIDEPVVISPSRPEGTVTLFDVKFGNNNFWSNSEDRSYRGEIELGIDNGFIKIINVLSVEEYLYGVVPSEMPANWPQEALKAQAVAARSETVAKLGRHRSDGFDLCAEVHCQVYSGVEKETELANMAVDSTRGMILEYDSKAVDAIYSSNCGGHTQDNIFGDRKTVAYFTGTADMEPPGKLVFPLSPFELDSWLKDPPEGIYCNIPEYTQMSNFRWVRIYSARQLRQMVDNVSGVGEVRKIIVLKRNPSGHIDKLKIVGSKTSCLIEKELNIRKALGNLRSSMFKVEVRYGQGHIPRDFIFYGGGWGHGVGMCQAGASGMAKANKNYQEILQRYFSRARLKKIY
jgi:stage II sporulation protein D